MRSQVIVLPNRQELDLSPYDDRSTPDWQMVAPRGFGDTASGVMEAEVVVDEDHEDDLMITEHPVQGGAVIQDHAFKRPADIRVRMGWSNAWVYDRNGGNVRQLYEQILRLQARRLPFTVFTGKRVYQNMLIASLRTHTDQKLEYTLMVDVAFKEIVLVGTGSVIGIGTQEAQANPEATTPESQRGPMQLTEARIPEDYALASGIPASELVSV